MLVQCTPVILMLSMLSLFSLHATRLSSLHAQEANAVGWHGITPGQSSEADLMDNQQWQNRLGPPVRNGASTQWTFRFPVWQKVVAEVHDGKVRVIDVLPPARLRAELLAEKLNLGELSPVSITRLPASVLVGPEEISAFQPLRCSKASNVLLFVEASQGKLYVQVMRILAPGSLQETDTEPPPTEKEVAGGKTERSPIRPDISLSATAFTKVDQRHASVVAAVSLLEKYHVSHHPLDETIARRAWLDLLVRFDPAKQLLTQRDVAFFGARLGRFADDLKRGDLRLAYQLAALLQQRAQVRSQQVANLLREPSPLEPPQAADLVESLGTYAANDAVLQERCRQRVSYLVAHYRRNGATTSEARQLTLEYERSQMKLLARLNDEDVRRATLAALAFAYGPGTSYQLEQASQQDVPGSDQRVVGIGVQIFLKKGVPTVLDVLVGGSAGRDGRLQPGDRILAVAADSKSLSEKGSDPLRRGQKRNESDSPPKGQTPFRIGSKGNYRDVLGMSLAAVTELIRGPEESRVRLRVLPANRRQPIEYELARKPFPPAVAGALLSGSRLPGNQDKKIGYLSVPAFQKVAEDFDPAVVDSLRRAMPQELQGYFGLPKEGEPVAARSTSQLIESHLREFSRQRVEAVVLDLRGSQGGELAEALAVTGLFIGSAPAGQLQMNDGSVYPLKATGQRSWSGPLVVATDRATRDEGELVAAALRDYGAAVLVGEVTTAGNALFTSIHASQDLGKSLFETAEAPNMGLFRLPDAMLYRVTGDGIQERGVRPDVILAASSMRLAADDGASELYAFDRIRPVPHEKVGAVTDMTRLVLTEKSHARRTASASAGTKQWRRPPLREVPWLVFDATFDEILAVTLDLVRLKTDQK